MWEYNQTPSPDELYHYGVKGMRWGTRRAAKFEARASRRYAKYGRKMGAADYERSKGAEAYKKHNSAAQVLDKQAKKSEAQGNYFRAEAARRSAAALRSRGSNIRSQHESTAASYEKRANRMNEKAAKYANKKHVNLNKKKINSIQNDARKKGYERAKEIDQWNKEMQIEEKYGAGARKAYRYASGR